MIYSVGASCLPVATQLSLDREYVVRTPIQSFNLQRLFGNVAGNDRLVRLYDGTRKKHQFELHLFLLQPLSFE